MRTTPRALAVLMVLALVLTACGGDDDGGAETTVAETTTTAAAETTTTTSETTETTEGAVMAGLADVCPDPVIIQTDWFPESEHGGTYELVGDDYTVDVENQIVSGSLVASGEDTTRQRRSPTMHRPSPSSRRWRRTPRSSCGIPRPIQMWRRSPISARRA
jgi:hypothetical protein